MKKSKFTEAQIVFALKQSKSGVSVSEICRKMGISEATFYNWKKKYGGLGVSKLRELRQLRDENARLKQMVADLSLDKQMLQDVIKKNFKGSSEKGACLSPAGTVWSVDSSKLCGDDGSSLGLSLPLSSTARQTTQRAHAGDC